MCGKTVEEEVNFPAACQKNQIFHLTALLRNLAGLLCFCWLKHEEDEVEPTTVQKHSRDGYNLAALLFFGQSNLPHGNPKSHMMVYPSHSLNPIPRY
jgi:hypothetical protein